MSIFFFDITDAHAPIPCQGVELLDIGAARREALQYAGQLLKDEPDPQRSDHAWSMKVSDADHLTLFTLTILSHDAPGVGVGGRRNKGANYV